MWQNGRRIVEIPELLALVVHELDTEEQRKLMPVSRHFFRSIGPTAWKRVPRIDFLMKVIKGTEIKYSVGEAQWPCDNFPEITITLPLKPDLSRYHIYAPWVHELEILGGYSQEIHYIGPFLTLLRGNPPLPNLRRLTAYTGADIRSKPMINFIDMFMSPSLTEIRTIIHKKDHPTYTHPSLVPRLLKKVQETCPQIQVLEFYPGTYGIYFAPGPFTLSDQCCRVIQSFSKLRSFSSTTCVLNAESFGILGDLPCLESLGIRGSESDTEDPALDERFSIPENQFRKLIELRLYDLHPQDIKLLWGQPSIVKKLGFALIQTDPLRASDLYDGLVDGNNWIESFLMALLNLSPHLRGLIFDVGDEGEAKYEISEDTLNALDGLHKLVLKNLKIRLGDTYGVDEDLESEAYDNED